MQVEPVGLGTTLTSYHHHDVNKTLYCLSFGYCYVMLCHGCLPCSNNVFTHLVIISKLLLIINWKSLCVNIVSSIWSAKKITKYQDPVFHVSQYSQTILRYYFNVILPNLSCCASMPMYCSFWPNFKTVGKRTCEQMLGVGSSRQAVGGTNSLFTAIPPQKRRMQAGNAISRAPFKPYNDVEMYSFTY